MKNNHSKLLILLFLTSLLTGLYSNLYLCSVEEQKLDYINKNQLKSNDHEISIVTPYNKAYTEAMSGYYPGTFGFEQCKNYPHRNI